MDSDIDTLKNNCVSSTDVTDLSREIEAVGAESRSFMCAANDAEQFSRRNNLSVLGLTLNPTDDGRSVVTSFLCDKFVVFMMSDIEAAHPLPVRQRNADSASAASHSTSSEPVIVRFRSRELRDSHKNAAKIERVMVCYCRRCDGIEYADTESTAQQSRCGKVLEISLSQDRALVARHRSNHSSRFVNDMQVHSNLNSSTRSPWKTVKCTVLILLTCPCLSKTLFYFYFCVCFCYT